MFLTMVGWSDPLPTGTMIWSGSLEFRATGNGYLLELHSPRTDHDAPALEAFWPVRTIGAHGTAQDGSP